MPILVSSNGSEWHVTVQNGQRGSSALIENGIRKSELIRYSKTPPLMVVFCVLLSATTENLIYLKQINKYLLNVKEV